MHWSTCTKILGIYVDPDFEHMIRINYESLIQKTKRVLDKWNFRKLTLLGKIQVVNSLIVPLLTQKLSCLPTPTPEIFKAQKDLITKFIWNKAVPRISYVQLVQTLVKGGLKLTDMRAKDIALKSTWVKKSLNTSSNLTWKELASEMLPDKLDHIWEYNISFEDIRASTWVKSELWKSIWSAWTRIHFKPMHEIQEIEDILNQKIRLNSNVRINGKPVLKQGLEKYGIYRISDLYDRDNGYFLNFMQTKNKYNLENGQFLTHGTIINAIPKIWKEIFKNGKENITGNLAFQDQEEHGILDTCIAQLSRVQRVTLWVYQTVNPRINTVKDKARYKWNCEL